MTTCDKLDFDLEIWQDLKDGTRRCGQLKRVDGKLTYYAGASVAAVARKRRLNKLYQMPVRREE